VEADGEALGEAEALLDAEGLGEGAVCTTLVVCCALPAC
jgi:hypothetical protein